MNDAFDHARSIAVTLLHRQPARTPEVIRAQVALAVQTTRAAGMGEVDPEALVAQLMHEANVFVPDATLMEDPTDHIEWLPSRRGSIDWRFWSRYKAFLEQEKKLPEPVVSSLGKLTDEILGKLEQPERNPVWDCRGMVVGSVQSGKTANYCGLICKAVDAGYKLIVVLAGMHKNLRSQTQYRVDEGVIGRDSGRERALDQRCGLIGVGKMFGGTPAIHTLTNSLDNGDFKAAVADTIGMAIGSDPVVLVVKKNGRVLHNLLKWVISVKGEETPGKKNRVIRGVPLLLIDDEADNASINTKDRRKTVSQEEEVTAINGRIRELLDAFEKSAYVGYTATPFANIFINPDAETPKHGEDLFPRSFVLNVSPPSNYVSPSRMFGLDGDPDSGIEPRQELPLFRLVDDNEKVFPPRHKRDLPVEALPDSLKHALYCFVLVCAARRARGQTEVHNSMLVHVTRFVDVQHQVSQLIQQQIDSIRRRIALGEGAREQTLLSELSQLWRDEFQPTSAAIRAMSPDDNLPEVSWDQVAAELSEAAARIEVKEINGHATDALDYVAHRQGFNVVAVGGDKLSRGLTLEGLSVSYFLRASQMYDTLMQMGRWFGYRPGYLDLCRLFTTEELRRWYRHIALAEVELRREFDRMKAAGLTPRRYGLRVREHPDGLLITALNKMAHARTQKLSYAGQLVQTAYFATDPSVVRANFKTVEKFLESLGGQSKATETSAAWLWRSIRSEHLLENLLTTFKVASESWRLQLPELMKFIRTQADHGELTTWTVALVNTHGEAGKISLVGCDVGLAQRKPEDGTWPMDKVPSVFVAPNANIQSPSHQALDLELPEMALSEALLADLLAKRAVEDGAPLFKPAEEALLHQCCLEGVTLGVAAERLTLLRRPPDEDAKKRSRINGEVARQLRPKTHGLLLIYPLVPKGVDQWCNQSPFMGLAFSFPSSHTARAVDYRVNKVWQATFHDEDYAD
ncbi:MAG: Z1 domain-containing protein [Verrucomicrobiota bacterium]